MKSLTLILTSLIFIVSSVMAAEDKIYHWVDADGKSHFSDTAVPAAVIEEINVRDQNLLVSFKGEEIPNPTTEPEIEGKEETKTQNVVTYHSDITSPEDDAEIRSNDGTLNIQVATTPEKRNSDTYQLFLDGHKIGKAQRSTTIRALNIERGTHQIQVHLLDKDGELLTKTQIVTINIQRSTAN